MLQYIINIGSSTNVSTIDSDSIEFAVTSPPYGPVVDYDRDNPDNIGNYGMDEYFKRMELVYSEVFRILKPGRKFAVNIVDLVSTAEDGKMTFLEYEKWTLELLQKVGFVIQTKFRWNKGSSKRLGHSGSIPYPPSPVIVIDSEVIFVMRKPGSSEPSILERERELSKLPPDFISTAITDVWNIKAETSIKWHPAPYPEELIARLVRLYSFVGETVYDPFLGSGTTMAVCKKWGRSCIGTEIGYNLREGSKYQTWLDAVKARVGWKINAYGEQVIWKVIDLNNASKCEESITSGIEKPEGEIQKASGDLFSFTTEK
ncbi:MAG: DNA-methyltransferase [Bacillati bacterium]